MQGTGLPEPAPPPPAAKPPKPAVTEVPKTVAPEIAVLQAFEQAGAEGLLPSEVPGAAGLPFDLAMPEFSKLYDEGTIAAFHGEGDQMRYRLATYNAAEVAAAAKTEPAKPTFPSLTVGAKAIYDALASPDSAAFGYGAAEDWLHQTVHPNSTQAEMQTLLDELQSKGVIEAKQFHHEGFADIPGVALTPAFQPGAAPAPAPPTPAPVTPAADLTPDEKVEWAKQSILKQLAETGVKKQKWDLVAYPTTVAAKEQGISYEQFNTALNDLVTGGYVTKLKNGYHVKITATGKAALAAGTAGPPAAKATYAGEPVSSTAQLALGKAIYDVMQAAGADAQHPLTVKEIGKKINLNGKGFDQYIDYTLRKRLILALDKLVGNQQLVSMGGYGPHAKYAVAALAPVTATSPIGKLMNQVAAKDKAVKSVLDGTPAPAVTTGSAEELLADEPVLNLAEMTFTAPKTGGTAMGGWYRAADGTEYLVKWGYGSTSSSHMKKYWDADLDGSHAKSEVLASKLAQATGLPAVECRLVRLNGVPGHPELDGKLAVASKKVPLTPVNLKAKMKSSPAFKKDVYDNFALHAWLANWDVVGLAYDNLVLGPDGHALCIDLGGSLQYHAQGKLKKDTSSTYFANTVTEWDNFQTGASNAHVAAEIFSPITDEERINSAVKVMAIQDDLIRALVEKWGPGDAANKKLVADTLIARKYYIIDQAKYLENKDAVDKAKYEEWHNKVIDVPADLAAIHAATPAIGVAQQKKQQADAAYHALFGYYYSHGFIDPDHALAATKAQVLAAQYAGLNMGTYDGSKTGLLQGAQRYNTEVTRSQARKAWVASPTAGTEGQQALLHYTGGSYQGQNGVLRQGKPSADAANAVRGWADVAEPLASGAYMERGVNLDSKVINNLKQHMGAVIQECGFSSCDDRRPLYMGIGDRACLCIYATPGARAANVSGFSKHKGDEREVIFGVNQKFLLFAHGKGQDMAGTQAYLFHVLALPNDKAELLP